MKLKTKIIISLLVFFIIVNVFIAIIFHSFTRKSIERDFIDSKTKLTEHYAYTVISTIVEKDVLKAETTLNNILKDNEILYIFITDFDNNKFIDKYSKNITPKRQKQISSFINSQKNSHIRRKIIESNILYIGIPIIEELDAYIYIGYSIKALNVLFIRQFLIFTITSVIIFILAIIFIFKFAYLITTPVTQLCNYMNLYAKYKLSLKDIKLKSYSIETDLLMNSFINMINDREKLESQIKKEQKLLQTLSNKISMEISFWDENLYLVDLNNSSLINSNNEKKNIIGKHISEIISGFEKTERYNEYGKVIKTGKSYFEQTSFEHNGKLRYVNIEAFPIENGLGVIITDITEIKEQQYKLQQRDKMRSLGELAGGIAHDFNNQLAGIMGGADLILMHTNEPNTKENAELIIKASEKSADLINQLLAFARKGQYRLKPISMHSIINEVVKILERSINKQISIKNILNATFDTVKCDENQIQNMILNLCLNARDSINGDGVISIVTDITELDDDYCSKLVYVIEPGDYFTISITDTGIGMDKKTVNRIFEPFYTTKPIGKGTGMGLASVYGTIKNHKGAINVYSEKGHGSTFRIYLPLSNDTEINIEEKNNNYDLSILKDKCILMIDDEKMILDVSEKILKNIGVKPILFENGKNAIKYYKQNYKKIDIVFIDMIMPDISGSELFDELISINPQIKAIILSGYSLNGKAEQIMNKGAISFLQKPYTLNKLKETLCNILSQ